MSKKKVINELVGKNIQYLIDSDPNENKRKLSDALDVDRRTVSRWTNENIFPETDVTEYLVRKLVYEGYIPSVQCGNKRLACIEDICAYLYEGKRWS